MEVCNKNIWGTVCDNFWGIPSATVACRQLGFSATGGSFFTEKYLDLHPWSRTVLSNILELEPNVHRIVTTNVLPQSKAALHNGFYPIHHFSVKMAIDTMCVVSLKQWPIASITCF